MKHSVNTECSVVFSIHCSKEQQTCARSYQRTVAAAKNSEQVLDHTRGLLLQQRIANMC